MVMDEKAAAPVGTKDGNDKGERGAKSTKRSTMPSAQREISFFLQFFFLSLLLVFVFISSFVINFFHIIVYILCLFHYLIYIYIVHHSGEDEHSEFQFLVFAQ